MLKIFGRHLYIKIAITAIVLSVILFLYSVGTKNSFDPFWKELDTVMNDNGLSNADEPTMSRSLLKRIIPVSERLDTIEYEYGKLHNERKGIDSIIRMISEPFLPDWEYKKLFQYTGILLKNKKIVLSGVSGSGKTTVVERLAAFVAGSKSRITQMACVEKLDVEYHKIWVGSFENGKFTKGRLLELFEKCNLDSTHNYVFVIDDIDKIYPATFFGAEIWQEFDNPDNKSFISGYPNEIAIPDNFYLISVTHTGVANTIELNDEHYRRLGNLVKVQPDFREFVLNLKTKKYNEIPKLHKKKLLYFFRKANDFIEKNYGDSYMLGQWSSIRKLCKPEDWDKFIGEFLIHVNAFKPARMITKEDFQPIFHAIENNGEIPSSSFLYNTYHELVSIGIFSELTVGLAFAVVSAVFGWFVLVKKRKFLSSLQAGVMDTSKKFQSGDIDFEEAVRSLVEYKTTLEQLIYKQKIRYEDAIYFFLYLNEQMNVLENTNKMSRISEGFIHTFEEYMEDGILTDDEYAKLNSFLANLRNVLSPEVYYKLKDQVDTIYKSNSLTQRD